MARRHGVERLEVHRRVLADRGVGPPAGLDADDAIRRQRLAAHEEFHVLAREDVVGDDTEPVPLAHRLAQRLDERGLARPHRSANADTERLVHDRNNLECRYCCVIAAMSIIGVNDSGRWLLAAIRSPTAGTRSSVRDNRRCASVWAIGIRRIAADTVAASRVYAYALIDSRRATPADAHAAANATGKIGPMAPAFETIANRSSRASGCKVCHVVSSRWPMARLDRR